MVHPVKPNLRLVRGGGDDAPGLVAPHDELQAVAAAAVSGDSDAIRTLVLTIGPHILRVVRKVLGATHSDVDDVAQQCAFAVIDALPKRRGDSTVLYFACRIAALGALKVRRRDAARKRSAVRDDQLQIELFQSPQPAPDEQLSARVSANLVRELIDSLPFEQAEVLTLHCVLGFTVQEISDLSRVPVETLRSRMRLAKQALRKRVAGDPRLGEIVEEPWS